MHRCLKPILGLIGITTMSMAFATTSIDTTASWNGVSNSGPFGEPDTATFGQSITTDSAGGSLQSFTFYLGPLDLDFRAYVFEWHGSKVVGPALFTSDVKNIGDAFTGYQAVTVATGDVALGPSKQYVLLFSSSGLQVGKNNADGWASLKSNAYAGGEFVLHNSGNDFSSLSAASGWDCGDGCGFNGMGADLVFKAQIVAVPEPSKYALLISGLGFMGFEARRRRS